MKLLQISEPDNQPHDTLALGIDLGTTNSLAALKQKDGQLVLMTDQDSNLVPSVVAYGKDGNVCVGNNAKEKIGDLDWVTFSSIKRYMGISSSHMEGCRYKFNSDESLPRFIVWEQQLTAQEISASILKHMARLAKSQGAQIGTLVITVPAYFDDAQRKATRDAAKLAGLPLQRLLNEPTAAALAYGLENKGDGYIAVFDLGGGTFDISILKCSDSLLKVQVSAGDTKLGGDDFDLRLLQLVITKLNQQFLGDKPLELQQLEVGEYLQLLQKARLAKEALTLDQHAFVDLRRWASEALIQITRQEFAEATADLLSLCVNHTIEAIRDAQLKQQDISSLVLVGGSTRMPQVAVKLRELLPQVAVYDGLNPDTTVAMGAAQLASVLAGEASPTTLVDVLPLSLGIEVMHGLMEKIIPRNTPLPVTCEQHFTTAKDGQQQFLLHVLQGERELVGDCRSLARFVLKGIPPMPAASAKLNVSFSVDASGVLEVSAREEVSGISQQIQLESSAGLDQQEIAALLQASHKYAKQDMQDRIWREALIEAGKLEQATIKAMQLDGELLEPDEEELIRNSVEQLVRAKQSANIDILGHANKQLVDATTVFAHRRMEKNLKASLINKPVKDG